MTRRMKETTARLERLEQVVDRISRSIDRIEVATIVREPASSLSAEAYDGLRKQVIAAAGERLAHLHQLALFAEAAASGDVDSLPVLVREWMGQAGLVRVDDAADERYYDVLAGEGTALRVLRPAYADRVTGRPIVMGQAERVRAERSGDHHLAGDHSEVRA